MQQTQFFTLQTHNFKFILKILRDIKMCLSLFMVVKKVLAGWPPYNQISSGIINDHVSYHPTIYT